MKKYELVVSIPLDAEKNLDSRRVAGICMRYKQRLSELTQHHLEMDITHGTNVTEIVLFFKDRFDSRYLSNLRNRTSTFDAHVSVVPTKLKNSTLFNAGSVYAHLENHQGRLYSMLSIEYRENTPATYIREV
jgi:hypothetical protein